MIQTLKLRKWNAVNNIGMAYRFNDGPYICCDCFLAAVRLFTSVMEKLDYDWEPSEKCSGTLAAHVNCHCCGEKI
jgi:hypothetical protein